MKLVHVEANLPDLFGAIKFRSGLNVVFAKVRDPARADRSSHNLGKSFLMEVLDFALGGEFDADHPFKKRKDLFGRFVFTLQIQTHAGTYMSVRRPVGGRAACAILLHDTAIAVGDYPEPAEWTHHDLSVKDYVEVIGRTLALTDLSPYPFRKGLSYQMRGQADYNDEFNIRKFAPGKDRDWRPFTARILGFDPTVLLRAYDIEDRIGQLQKTIIELEGKNSRTRQQYDDVRGLIEIRGAEIAARREELARFQFTGVEREVNRELVGEIETKIADLNMRRYTIDRDLLDIEKSLQSGFAFDVDLVRGVYQDAGVELPGSLVREYEDLVEFNRRISSDRGARLTALRAERLADRAAVESEVDGLDRRRQQAMSALRDAESFAKYRQLTEVVFGLEADLRDLRERLGQLGQAAALKAQVAEQEKALVDARSAVQEEVQASNAYFTEVRRLFNDAVQHTLGVPALLSARLNNQKHIDFKTAVLDQGTRQTFEGDGTSYKKLLCACVDLALIRAHADGRYYRFLYHDGVFEGLDNRKKVALANYVRSASEADGFQYILTVIDSDLPRDETDNKLVFDPSEVILTLHDGGDEGRLFRMATF